MLQDDFLRSIVQARVSVTIYLTNGIRLLGQVESFDQYGIVLSGTAQQFIYKHAISTVVPARDVTHAREPAAAEPAKAPAAAEPAKAPVAAAEPAAEPQAAPQPTTTTLRPRRKRTPGTAE